MRNPMSLEGLRDWLKTKPSGGEYPWHDITGCLMCQYFDHIGVKYLAVCRHHWLGNDGVEHMTPPGFAEVAATFPHTYGAAIARAEKLIAEGAGQASKSTPAGKNSTSSSRSCWRARPDKRQGSSRTSPPVSTSKRQRLLCGKP